MFKDQKAQLVYLDNQQHKNQGIKETHFLTKEIQLLKPVMIHQMHIKLIMAILQGITQCLQMFFKKIFALDSQVKISKEWQMLIQG